jgi:hypothetical protein
VGSKTARAGELDRIEPKLGGALVALDVNVRRLSPFEAVEEEAKPGNIHHRRHGPRLPLGLAPSENQYRHEKYP